MWDIVANIYRITFSSAFFILGYIMFIISKRGFKSKNNYGGGSTLACGILFLLFGFFNLFFPRENGLFMGFLPYPFSGFMVWWIGIVLIVNLIFSLIMRRNIKIVEEKRDNENTIEKKEEKLKPLQRYIVFIKSENPYTEQISFKMEAIRKAFHLSCILILLAYYGFYFIPPLTSLINDSIIIFIHQVEWSYNILWGDVIAQYPYVFGDPQAAVDLTLFALIAALFFMITSEIIRVLGGPEYSLFNVLTRAVLRNKEYNAIGPQIYLICGAIMAYILYIIGLVPGSVIMTVIVISCISDALAALIGRKWGKHKITCLNGDKKSIEGFLAGAGSAFLIGIVPLGPFYALIGALIFLILDYFPVLIADNILNPILITIGIIIINFLTGFPIGW